ncbi:hypothetical protein KGA66_28250 [Actinocrinis puniceicyclus]|uniref:Uncharacterized protein n=1 Tax=Actinocrinis puniceicyclus TaxID=977794 RepID=A0A8J7WR70_9ACTN|nr:hypothetical protein [Actinocrinis puniceicyclus]MBS2966958.1 hypothetical protein [Actinocrinis puniceicyclus]
MTSPTPPNPPLSDPELFARIQEDLGSDHKWRREQGERDKYLLERFAWQEYPVKLGRWSKIADPKSLNAKTILEGLTTRWVWEADLTAVLIFDPATRRPLCEYEIKWPKDQDWITPRITSLWFAGDLRFGGLFTAVGDGRRTALGSRREVPLGTLATVAKIEQFAPKYIAKPFEVPDKPGVTDGPWISDHPQMPEPQGPPLATRLLKKLRG